MSDMTYTDATIESMTNLDGDAEAVAAGNPSSLLHNFGVASMLVVAGVVVSGFLLTSEPTESALDLPAMPTAIWLTEGAAGGDTESWIDLADRAFASGRITEPVTDNALYYFHQAVLVNSADDRAREGLDKVVSYVIGGAETAVYESDWAQARRAAESILLLIPDHSGAKSVLVRTEKFEKLEELSQRAVNQLATDRLLSPRGDNALSSYRRINRLDPGNAEAAVGIQTIAQRLGAKSQAAAFDGDFEASAKYMKQARGIAPNLSSLDQAAKMTDQFAKLTQEKAALVEEGVREQAIADQLAAASSTSVVGTEGAERIFGVSDLTVERSVAPTFPRRAEASQQEGWVELNFRIDSLGNVFDAEVVRSSDAIFESSALGAIRKWQFAPYRENGIAMPIRSGVRFSFRQ